jgi:hypothetical protein
MPSFEVGKPYLLKHSTCSEGSEYSYSTRGYELKLCFSNPFHEEIASIADGNASFDLLIEEGIVFFLFRFDPGIPWSCVPYCYWGIPEDQRQVPPPHGEQGTLLTVLLIDADNSLLKAVREVELEPSFCLNLHHAIATQLAEPISMQEYKKRVDKVYRKYLSTASMIQGARLESLTPIFA